MPTADPSPTIAFRRFLEQASRVVVFTGAGISTESGVSDYRSKGGLWDRYQPVAIQEFVSDPAKRRLYWQRKKEMFGEILGAEPNAGHRAIARLEGVGANTHTGAAHASPLLGVITQNIDGFHQLAGSRRVIELHGTNREVICLACGRTGAFDPVYARLLAGETDPHCLDCGGLLKPNTISFGQALHPAVLEEAVHLARTCDLLLAVGSTLVVEPAASLPRLAKESGATLIILNREPTPLDPLADLVLRAEAGPFLDQAIPDMP